MGTHLDGKERKGRKEGMQFSRSSVIQQNVTKLASIATRSTAAKPVNPVTDGSSLLHWLTPKHRILWLTGTRCSSGGPFKGNTGAPEGAAKFSADP